MKKCIFQKMMYFCIAKTEAKQEKVIFCFSDLKLANKDVWCIDTISNFFLLISVISHYFCSVN